MPLTPLNPLGTRPRIGGTMLPRRLPTAPVRTAPTPATPQLPAGTDESVASTNEPLPTLPQVPTTPVPATGGPSIPPPPMGEPTPTATLTPTSLPSTPTQTPVPATPVPATPSGPTLTPTDPNNPLTAQTIGANGINRFDLAKQQFDTFVQGTNPAYQAALRDAKRVGAAAGGLGSGMLRTNVGDLANTRANALDVQQKQTFQDALLGSVDDARFATGVTQQQQGFQSEQQQRAFENELRRLGFDEEMLNSAFGRGLATWNAGNLGGTGSGTQLAGAANTQGQAQGGQDALAELIRLLAQRQNQPGGSPIPPGTMVPTTGGIGNA